MRSPRTLLFRTLGFMLVSLAGLSAPGCISLPDYPDTPEIEFRSITVKSVVIQETPFDKIDITVGYRDGDGDLGLADETSNPNTLNYFCQLQVRQTDGSFIDVDPPADRLDGRYPNLTPASQGDRKAPLRGEIFYEILFPPNFVTPPGTVIRFRIYILDRALHRSNDILTQPITIPK